MNTHRHLHVAPPLEHEEWCNDHLDDPDSWGLCSRRWDAPSGMTVELCAKNFNQPVVVDVWPRADVERTEGFSPEEARLLAAWLVEAAELADAS